MFKRIMVAFDESPESRKALDAAISLAVQLQSELIAVTVVEPLPYYMGLAAYVEPELPGMLQEQRRRFYEDLHRDAVVQARKRNQILSTYIIEGDEVEGIIESARQHNISLLVFGLRKSMPLLGAVSSTAHQLAQKSPWAVLAIGAHVTTID